MGQPSRCQRGTPPSTTWITSRTPKRFSRLAADGRALPRGADRRDRPSRVDLLRQFVDVVVGAVDRSGDVARVPLRLLADVEQLHPVAAAVPALVELGTVSRSTRSTGCFSSRHEVIPPAR